MLVEILVIVGISGLVSACAAWGCPSILKKKKKGDETNEEEGDREDQISLRMMIFTQGQCSSYLVPNDRDLKKINNSQTTTVKREKMKIE